MSNTLRSLSKVKHQLSALVVLIALLYSGTSHGQTNQVIRYVRVGGSDLKTGITQSVNPNDPAGAFATIQRAIDEYAVGYFHPNTGNPIPALPPGTTYIIDVGPGIYNDPSTIVVPDNYAIPGLQQQLIVRGPRVADSPNAQAYPGGPTIREYNPTREAIIQTSYGANANGALRPGHRPLISAPAPNANQLPPVLGVNRPIVSIGCNNRVTFDGLIFEATRNNGGNIPGGRIFEVDNSGCNPGSVSTTNLAFEQNIFMGANEFTTGADNRGINYFNSIVQLNMNDNRFHNITWENFPGVSNSNNRRATALWTERVYHMDLTNNHFVGNLNNDINNLPIKTMDDAIHVENSNLASVRININNNQISKNRGTGIYVDNRDVIQDTVVITKNNLYDVASRYAGYLLQSPGAVNGVHIRNSKNFQVVENRFGTDYGFFPVNGVAGHSINIEDARKHTIVGSLMHKVESNIVTNGTDGDGIMIQRSLNVSVAHNTITNAFYSGIHITDWSNTGISRMENIMVHSNTITRANNRSNVGSVGNNIYANYIQSGGVSIFSDIRNTGKYNTSTKIYVTNNIIKQCGNAGLVIRNNEQNINVPALSRSNIYKKDIRANYNIFWGNDNPNDGAYNPGLVRNNSGVKVLAQNNTVQDAFIDGAFRYGQLDATGNWWDYQSHSAMKYGPVDSDNPLNNNTFPLGGLNNLGAGQGQRVNEINTQRDVVLYSPWLGGRVMDVEAPDNGNAAMMPDDDASLTGYQNQSPVYYYGVMLNGAYPIEDFNSIGINSDPSYPASLTSRAFRLMPTLDVCGVDGMINKGISLAKDMDVIEMWRGMYIENVVIPNKFGTVSGSEGHITIRSVENDGVTPPAGETTMFNAASSYRGYSAALSSGRNGIANVTFTPNVSASNPSVEATVRQITSTTMGAALNILDNNRVNFSGFRIETNTNQAVNSAGSNVMAMFNYNLVEVYPSQRNSSANGLISFRDHRHGLDFTHNTIRKVAGETDAAAVALNVINLDGGMLNINDNVFDGAMTMSKAIVVDGCASEAGMAHIMRNAVYNTYYNGIQLYESGSTGANTNQHIAWNDVFGANSRNASDNGGVSIAATSAGSTGIVVEYNNFFKNRRSGVVLPSGLASAVRVNYNLFHNNDPAPGNGTALISNATGVLDAAGNWWGSAYGPIIGADVNGAGNTNRNNGGSPNIGTPSPFDHTNGSRLSSNTLQQRIIGSNVSYNPWLGGMADNQDPADHDRDPLTPANASLIGTDLPDRDNTMRGVQFVSSAPLAVREALAWYIGVWNAGPLAPNGSGFIQRANDLSDIAGGDWLFFHDDNYRDSKQNVSLKESVRVNRDLRFKSVAGTTIFEDITVVDGKLVEMFSDFTVTNIRLSGVGGGEGNGMIYTYPYETILPSALGQPSLYQLYDITDLRVLSFTGEVLEGAGGKFVHGKLQTSRTPQGISEEKFGNIGYALIPGAGASTLGKWTILRTADTKNQQPPLASPQNPNRSSDPSLPPQNLSRELSPFFAFNGSPSIDQGWIAGYEGNDPQNWNVRLSWFSDNDPLDETNNFNPFLPSKMFVGNVAGFGPGILIPIWQSLDPVDNVANNDPRSVPSTGVMVGIGPENFDIPSVAGNERRGLFSAFAYQNNLRAFAGNNAERCANGDGILLGGVDPLGDPDNALPNAFTARGGVPPYAYSWSCSNGNCGLNSTTVANPIARPSADSTVYYVRVTDAVGNVSIDSVTVFVNQLPSADFNLASSICQNSPVQTLVSNVNGGHPFTHNKPLGLDYLYYWTTSPDLGSALMNDQFNNAMVDPSSSNIVIGQPYRVTMEVEDAKGCVLHVTKTTVFYPAPVAEAGSPRVQVCQNGTTVLGGSPSGSGGTGNLSYNWVLTSARNVSANMNVANPGAGAVLNSSTISNPTFTPNMVGSQDIMSYSFTLEVRDVNNCLATDNITVEVYPLPSADAGMDMEYCFNNLPMVLGPAGSVATNGTAPYTYSWTSNSPNSSSAYLENGGSDRPYFNAPNVASVTDFSYVVTVTDVIGCSASDDVSLRVHPELKASAGPDVVTCVNSKFWLGGNPSAEGGNGNFSYTWTPNQGLLDDQVANPENIANPTARLPFAGTYTYTLRVENSDIGCIAFDDAQVVVGTQLVVNAGTYAPVCAGSDLQIMANIPGVVMGLPGYNYTWTPSDRLSSGDIPNPVFNTSTPGSYTYTVDVVDPNGCQGKSTTTIVVNPIPVVNGGSDVVICAESMGMLNGSATGGTAMFPQGYNYTWTPDEGLNDDNAAVTGVSLNYPGTYYYTLTAVDGNNCSASDEVMVTVNALPVVNAGSDMSVCPGTDNSISASVSGGTPDYTYSWNPSMNLSDASVMNPVFNSSMSGVHTYMFTSTDANGCSRMDEVSVMVLPTMTVSAGNNAAICPGGSVQLNGSVSGGTPGFGGGYEYEWMPATGLSNARVINPTFSSTEAGTYDMMLKVTDARGCTAGASVTVVVNPNPVANAGSDLRLCTGDFTQLAGSASNGDGNYNYMWMPSANLSNANAAQPTYTASNAGTFNYTLRVVDGNGCMGEDFTTIVVNPVPSVNAGADRVVCVGNSATLQANGSGGFPGPSGYSYSWSPIVNLSNASISNPTFSSNIAGTYNYTVMVTDANGCSAEDMLTVVSAANPVASAGLNKVTCTNASISLDGNATSGTTPYSYSWMPIAGLSNANAQSPMFSASIAGQYNYSVVVTDGNGCTSQSSVSITVNPSPSANAGGDQTICAGGVTTLVGVATGGTPGTGYGYLWSPAVGLDNNRLAVPTLSLNTPGSYTYMLTVTDANNCTSTDNVVVTVKDALVANAGGSVNACTGASMMLNSSVSGGSAPYSYRWTPETNLSSRTAAMPTFLSNVTGDYAYTLEVTDANGCMTSSRTVVRVNASPSANAGADRQGCVSSPIQLMGIGSGGAGSYSYNWSPSSMLSAGNVANPIFRANSQGTYDLNLTVTDANGCSAVDALRVVVNFDLNVNAGNDTGTCRGQNITLNGTITGGSENGATFSWSPVTNLLAANTLRPTFIGQNPGTYTYTLTVTDINGCSGSDQVVVTVVNPPVADAGSDQLICTQGSIQLRGAATNGSGNYSYSWSPANRLSDRNAQNPVFSSAAPGIYNYTLRVTDNVSGCTSDDMVQVEAVSVPLPELVVTKVDVSCDGDSDGMITATARVDAQYPYQNFVYSIDGINYQSSNFFTNLRAGTYTVYAMNETQCIVSTVVTVNTPATTQITSISQITETSAVVNWTAYNGRGNVRYVLAYRVVGSNAWTTIENIPGSNNSYVLTNLQNYTNYEVQVRSRCNSVLAPNWSEVASFRTLEINSGTCKKSGGVYVNEVNGANSVIVSWNANPTGVCYDLQYGLATANPSTWTVVSGLTTNSYRIDNLTPGFTYSVRVATNCNSCQATGNNRSEYSDVINFSVDNLRGATTTSVVATSYKVYPNPTSGDLTIDFEASESGPMSVVITDVTGRVVLSQNYEVAAGINNIPVSLSGNTTGVYLMEIKQGTQKQTVKVILQ